MIRIRKSRRSKGARPCTDCTENRQQAALLRESLGHAEGKLIDLSTVVERLDLDFFTIAQTINRAVFDGLTIGDKFKSSAGQHGLRRASEVVVN